MDLDLGMGGMRPLHASLSLKYLGLITDWRLTWNDHLNHLEAKAGKKIAVLGALAGSTWGAGVEDLRNVYVSTVLPQFLYCCSVWFTPNGGYGTKGRGEKALQLMRGLQRREAKMCAGAFRTVSGAALDVELYLLPIKHALDNALNDSLLRTITSPIFQHVESMREPHPLEALSREPNWLTPSG